MDNKYPLRAGAAKGDITLPEEFLPVTHANFGVLVHILDRIFVRVLALSDGEREALYITFDMGGVPFSEETLAFIQKETGLPGEYVFMAATHTHEVPFIGGPGMRATDDKWAKDTRVWYESILKTLGETIQRARENMAPAKLGFGTGASYLNVNRDEIIDGRGTLGNNFERPSDKTLTLIRIEDMASKPIAFIVNYAMHAVVLHCNAYNGGMGVSGDLPGRTSAALENKYDGAVALWTSGAAGDQNPRQMSVLNVKTGSDGKMELNTVGEPMNALLDNLTAEHMRDIEKVNGALCCDVENARIFAAGTKLALPGRHRLRVPGTMQQVDTSVPAPDAVFTMRLLTVGDIAFEGISAEVVTTIGSALKEASPLRKTVIVTHCTHGLCYVPDDWGYENNTFEATGTLVQKGYAQPGFIAAFDGMFMVRNNT